MADEHLLKPGWKSRKVKLSKVELHCVVAGKGPPLVFLHGWPEFWYSWKNQISEFSRDHTVIVPDLRGFNHSNFEGAPEDFSIDELCADIADLIQAFSGEGAVVVGHDWGAIIAWCFAEKHPQLTKKLISLSIPHLKIFEEVHRRSFALKMACLHFRLLQPARLPEFLLSAFNFLNIKFLFRTASGNWAPVRSELKHYVAAIAKPGVLTSTINYYRANLNSKRIYSLMATGAVQCPTLLLYGDKDPVWPRSLRRKLSDTSVYMTGEFEHHCIADAGHWLQIEASEMVNRYMAEFIR